MGAPPPRGCRGRSSPWGRSFRRRGCLVAFLVDFLPLARAAAAPGAPGRATRGAVAVRAVLLASPASEEPDVVRDDVDLGAPSSASVLSLPGAVLQTPFEEDGIALLLVVGDGLPELAPRADVEEVHLFVPGAHPVNREPERADGYPVVGEPEFRISREVSG